MIKAIFFDFDGVLTNFECGSSTVCHNLSEKTGITEEKLLLCYDKHARDLYVKPVLHKEIWDDFCKCVGEKIDISLLNYAFRNTPMNEKMLELAKKIRKNYNVGIITDNTKERFSAIIDEFRLFDKFDAIILSADVGATKKDETIFKSALGALKVMKISSQNVRIFKLSNRRRRLEIKPDECVFIDNNARNLEVPARMGFKTIYFDFEKNDFEGLVKELSAKGVKL